MGSASEKTASNSDSRPLEVDQSVNKLIQPEIITILQVV